MPIAQGGTGATDAATALLNLSGNAIRASGSTGIFVGVDQNTGANTNTNSAFLTSMAISRYVASGGGPAFYLTKTRATAPGSHAIVQFNDALGTILFAGDDGVQYEIGASILAMVDGTPGVDDMPGMLSFRTTPDGSATPAEAMRLDSAQRMTTTSGRIRKTRTVTAAGAVAVAISDHVIFVNKTSGEATVVNLPSNPSTGTEFVIKDAKGDAASNNITLTPAAGNIDGASTFVMNVNRQAVTIIYNGTEWSVV